MLKNSYEKTKLCITCVLYTKNYFPNKEWNWLWLMSEQLMELELELVYVKKS